MAVVSVATLNLFNRDGEWESRFPVVIDQLEALAPDVIGFQEVDLMLDQGMQVARAINRRMKEHPHYRIKHAASPGKMASIHGIATLARLEFLEYEVIDLMTFDRMAQRCRFQVEGREFFTVNLHLHHPPEARDERVRQLQYLLECLDRDTRKLPVVILGDFNSYDGENAVAFMKSRFRSAHEDFHGSEPEKTWPTPVNKYDTSPPGTLDYIYVSEEFRIADAGLAFNEPAQGNPELYPSDHMGLYARLEL